MRYMTYAIHMVQMYPIYMLDNSYLKPAGPLNISINSRALLEAFLPQSALCCYVYIASASQYLKLVTELDHSW